MTPFTDLDEFKAMTEQLLELGQSIPRDDEVQDLRSPAYHRATERLQRALADFGKDSSNLTKLDLMLDAIDRYQTANEMLRIKLHTRIEQLANTQGDQA